MACTTERSLDNLGPWRKRRPCLPLVGHGGNWRASHETGLRSIASAGRFLLAQGTSKTKHGSTSTTPTQPRPLVGRTIRRLRLNQPAPQEGATMKQLFRKKFTWIFTLAIAMLVVVPFAAFADSLQADLNTTTGGLDKTVELGTLTAKLFVHRKWLWESRSYLQRRNHLWRRNHQWEDGPGYLDDPRRTGNRSKLQHRSHLRREH